MSQLNEVPEPQAKRLLTEKESRRLFDNPARSTWWEWVKAGKIPRPIKVGRNRNRWLREELDVAFESMLLARNGGG